MFLTPFAQIEEIDLSRLDFIHALKESVLSLTREDGGVAGDAA
jgi:hypothetical protein